MPTIDDFLKGVVSGFAAGALGILALVIGVQPNLDRTQTFQRGENKPAVMRLYKWGGDGIMVQDGTNTNSYIPLFTYLKQFKNPADKIIEEQEIKKVIGWYD